AIWLVPWFFVSFPLLLILYLTPTLAYVNLRNEEVDVEDRVLTRRHLRSLARRLLGLGTDEDKEKEKEIPIRFIGKSLNDKHEDPSRVKRAQESKGYRAALEMVYEAITSRATDIHMEPTKEEMTIRFRIDGILSPAEPHSRSMGDSIIN